MKKSMEDALSIGEDRGRELIGLLMKWQQENQLEAASTRIKWILDKIPNKVEAAFLIFQDGMATKFAEISDVFERFTGVDLSSVMLKLQTGEAAGLSLPDMDEVMRSSLKCPHCGAHIGRCPECKKDLFDTKRIIQPKGGMA
jgi:predicted RNA-binding Zn-ribbon protein involved in translation (DUF1610 family)